MLEDRKVCGVQHARADYKVNALTAWSPIPPARGYALSPALQCFTASRLSPKIRCLTQSQGSSTICSSLPRSEPCRSTTCCSCPRNTTLRFGFGHDSLVPRCSWSLLPSCYTCAPEPPIAPQFLLPLPCTAPWTPSIQPLHHLFYEPRGSLSTSRSTSSAHPGSLAPRSRFPTLQFP